MLASTGVHAQRPGGNPARIGYLGSNQRDSEVVRSFQVGLSEPVSAKAATST